MIRLIKHIRFLQKTPKASLKMMEGVLRTNLLGQFLVRNTQLAITFRCNHQCAMCSSSYLLQDKDELRFEQWCRIVDQLKHLGCTHFDITGGEPTLRGLEFLTALISYIMRKKDRITSLATNTKCIDARWLTQLNRAGLNSLLLNIQSLKPGVHDKITGDPGNLAHIKKIIPQAKKIGLNVCINTCLGTYNIDDIKELLEWCQKHDLFTLINLAAPTGRLTGKEVRMQKFRKEYYAILEEYPLARSDTSYNFRGPNLCPGGMEKLYITAYGEVMQCTFCQISFGNVTQEPLARIYRRFYTHPLIKKRYICKHTFCDEFRRQWIDPISHHRQVPVALKRHPNYHVFFSQKKGTC